MSTRLLMLPIAAMLAACKGSAAPPRVSAWPDTTSGEWVAVSVEGNSPLKGTRLTMATSPSGVGGYGGCNWYGITYDSSQHLIQSTARGCPGAIGDQEARFINLIVKAAFARTASDTLQLFDSARTEMLVFARRRAGMATQSEIVGRRWQLHDATSLTLNWPGITIRFTDDSASGFSGCRNFTGSYTIDRDRLRFTSLSMAPLDCADQRLVVFENNFSGALSETEHFDVRGDTLSLMTFGGDTLWFLPAK